MPDKNGSNSSVTEIIVQRDKQKDGYCKIIEIRGEQFPICNLFSSGDIICAESLQIAELTEGVILNFI